MSRLSFHELSFRYETNPGPVFEGLSGAIDPHARIGLIGGNGSGKSTLLAILAGKLRPSAGAVARAAGLRAGLLAQETLPEPGETLAALLLADRPDLRALRRALDAGDGEAYLPYLEAGGPGFEAEAARHLARVGLPAASLDRDASTLSGGERTRAGIARLLLAGADLLLLDEPTNHLDARALEGLATFLRGCGLPFVAASHDRAFLDGCVETVWELDRGMLRRFAGGYSDCRARKEEELRRSEIRHEAARKKIRRLTKALHDRRQWALTYQGQTGANGNAPVFESVMNDARRAMKRAKAVERRLEKMVEAAEAEKPWIEKGRRLTLAGTGTRRDVLLHAEGLRVAYGERTLFDGLSLTLRRGERVALTGDNGCGKTTLLRLLSGAIPPQGGTVARPPAVRFALLDQDDADLPPCATLLSAVSDGTPAGAERARTLLGGMGLRGDLPHRPVAAASPGERRKCALARAVLSGAALLLLDEPTNHLEIPAREALETALSGFDGALLFACHDRAFIRAVATRTLDLGGS